MTFFDANVCYGGVKTPSQAVDYSLDALLRRMKEYNIEKALVVHSMAREHDAPTGNELLMKEIKGHDCLLPVWVLLPHHTGEMEEPGTLTERMVKEGVKAATMLPSVAFHSFSMRRWSVGPLLDALCERRIPLIIGIEQVGGMEGLAQLALENPSLPIIATNVAYRADRFLYPLMEQTKNLYVETSSYKPYFGLQEFVKRFGAERLVFGSGMPAIDPAASAAVVTWSGLALEQQELIAHGNIERLIGEVR